MKNKAQTGEKEKDESEKSQPQKGTSYKDEKSKRETQNSKQQKGQAWHTGT
tara:strand:- start:42 stop:194 length:153 start_codon:yes stop_codon:yes gene_type:complete